ncbi:MAG: hypothetical protein L3K23_08515 [Thermoplasmata archaeon]|nr:hypothetical protein [Thermoplasmata archaeon]
MTDPTAPPVLRLQAAVPRSPSLGPFPSGRDALKFLAYAAAGAVVAGFVSPWLWLPFLAVGFVVGVRPTDGPPFDRRLADYLGWTWRRRGGAGGRPRARHRPSIASGRALAAVPGGVLVGMLRAEGIPVAFLPPANARELFTAYRQLLGSLDGGVALLVRGLPLGTRPFVPLPVTLGSDEQRARDGYVEMVRLLGRHRRRRDVLLAVGGPSGSPSASLQLERRLRDLHERLDALGVGSERLRGPALTEGLVAFGWGPGRSS